jgi:hypothetical protein
MDPNVDSQHTTMIHSHSEASSRSRVSYDYAAAAAASSSATSANPSFLTHPGMAFPAPTAKHGNFFVNDPQSPDIFSPYGQLYGHIALAADHPPSLHPHPYPMHPTHFSPHSMDPSGPEYMKKSPYY